MLSVQNLRKSYGSKEALRGISFTIKEGECFGLLGPNGAGKTTTISIISTLLPPGSGSVELAGMDPLKNADECKKVIGVVPQEIALYNQMSAWDNLMFWGSLYGIPSSELATRAGEILVLVGLADRKNDKVGEYSGGMKRRINIASALLHKPKILFMDEPTVGIDPQSRNLIFEVIEKLHKGGMTIIYTTHYMEEAERLCDRIGIIDNGTIIAQGTLEELKKSGDFKELITVTFDHLPAEKMNALSTAFPGSAVSGNHLQVQTHSAKTDLSKIVTCCNEEGLAISHIDIKKVDLETIFLQLTGKQLRD